ncbi:glycosyltransferase family 4 protein [Patescibacteria group bacterium]|nr:glycosyltransferase family 4 protein [Patescibacteria group bacterium]MBU1613189.1 glycosyltransferase family 4 protein [Patescibacteria group bacterium]
MNIGIDIRPLMSSIRTGVGEYTQELLNAVFALDKKNQYFLFFNSREDVSKNIPKWEQENVRYISTRWPNKLFNSSTKILNFPKIDKLSFPTTKSGESGNEDMDPRFREDDKLDVFFSPNINFTALSKKIKFVLTIHDLSFEYFPEFYTLKQRLWHKAVNPKKQCERADIIITPSENTKRDIVNCYKISTDKIKVIYPGVSPGFRIKSGMTNGMTGEKYVLFLGTIEPRKNIAGVIKAFEIFQKRYTLHDSRYTLAIAGAPGWKNEEIFRQINESPCKEKIKFIGCVKNEEKPALYSGASLFVYPSFYEGFGFPALEAMASGVPVITSNRSSLPEITESNATLVDPHRPEQIAQAMYNILTNQTLQENKIKNGLVQVAKFSWEKAAKEWLNSLPT